jgi:signal transduction histidine kinase
MQQKQKEEYEEYLEDYGHDGVEWEVDEQFLNYAMEASYYIYGGLLQEATGELVDFRVADWAGWKKDYQYMEEMFAYSATYDHDNRTTGTGKGNMNDSENIGYLRLVFDDQGNLDENIQVDEIGNNNVWIVNHDDYTYHFKAMESVDQYLRNVRAYETENNVEINEEQLKPKNFEITFALREDWERDMVWFVDYYNVYTEGLMFDVGVVWIMLAGILFVALMAFVLPFFKGLRTGWEKLFSIPFEIIVGLGVGAVFGFIGMFYAMGETCMLTKYPSFEILDAAVGGNVTYGALLAANMLGWAICFFVEYIVITSIRQLLFKPVYYLKHRLLLLIILRWIKNQCVKFYERLSRIDLREKRNKTILVVVLVNFAIIASTCSLIFLFAGLWAFFDEFVFLMWIFTMLTLVAYSVALYILLYNYSEKLSKQYNSILNATTQMAEGNLKISLEESLGIFQPIGDSLEKVQQGFEKAVVEEAKSQSMKTELITNVSHDLKTPLTAIITYVDLLKKEDITEDERKVYVDTLDKKSQRLKVLIEDLFEVSKAQSGNVQMNFMDVDVVSLMKQVKSEMEDRLEASDLTFRWNLPEEKIMLSLDGKRTYRVFENLISNALKYSMPHSRVYVDVENSKDSVKVIFRNTSAQELDFDPERLTERFVRGDASRKSEGSGLGLAIAKSFVELQNGRFKIEVDGDLFKVILTWNK